MTDRPKLSVERTFEATPQEIWDLWTTRDGMEAWMGPEGFTVTVNELDLRPGGVLVYSMTATGPEQVEYMTKAGMPLVTRTRMTFTEVVPPRRLVYRTVADFIPGVEPYDVETAVDLHASGDRVRVVVSFDSMHDDGWTKMAVLGREAELRKLEQALTRRS